MRVHEYGVISEQKWSDTYYNKHKPKLQVKVWKEKKVAVT